VISLTVKEIRNIAEYLREHQAICHAGYVGLHFYSCSGIGVTTILKCNCGKETDVTDYTAW
jgi:hypothetical protein